MIVCRQLLRGPPLGRLLPFWGVSRHSRVLCVRTSAAFLHVVSFRSLEGGTFCVVHETEHGHALIIVLPACSGDNGFATLHDAVSRLLTGSISQNSIEGSVRL